MAGVIIVGGASRDILVFLGQRVSEEDVFGLEVSVDHLGSVEV